MATEEIEIEYGCRDRDKIDIKIERVRTAVVHAAVVCKAAVCMTAVRKETVHTTAVRTVWV